MSKRPVAIISGSEGGIGNALMIELNRRGYLACGMDVVKEPRIDITFSLYQHFKNFLKDSGPLRIIINSAGITRVGGIRTKGIIKQMEQIFKINYFGCMNVCAEAVKWMKEGAIINIASKSAHVALAERLGYCASKGAIVSASRQMALDLAPDIRVNSISPGTIDTSMPWSKVKDMKRPNNLLKRKGEPEEVAKFILDIAENKYITGQDFIIDGGYCAV